MISPYRGVMVKNMAERLENCRKAGILGGTFNPIHVGHLILAEQAYEEFDLDRVLIMPSGLPYLKVGKGVLPPEQRYRMTELAIMDNPHFSISDREVLRDGNTYTSETITELNRDYPDIHFYFIIGADILFQMDSWKDPDVIFGGCSILASVRDGLRPEDLDRKIEEYEERFDADIRVLRTTNIDISSTMIREHAASGRSLRYYVPDAVREFILDNGLYLECSREEKPE